MPQTLPNGITAPINPDAYNLVGDLATFGNSANVIITVANQTARDALTPFPGMTVYRNDLTGNVLETWDGARWLSTAQTAYTPTLTASTTNPSIGTGSVAGTYSINGKTMIGQFYISFGAGSTSGSGSFQVSLPPGFTYTSISGYVPAGTFGTVGPGAPAAYITGVMRQGGASLNYFNLYWLSGPSTGSVIASNTFAWASGMNIAGAFSVTLA